MSIALRIETTENVRRNGIAHLRDPDSIPGFGQTREGNFNPHQPWVIGFKNCTLSRYGQSASRERGFKEVSSIKEL